MKRAPGKPARSRPLALPLRLGLFALMFLATLMIGARVQEVFAELAHGRAPAAFTPVRAAEEPAKPETGIEKKDETRHDKGEATPAADPPEMEKPAGGKEAEGEDEEEDFSDFGLIDEGLDLTEAEITVLRHLSGRRKELDKQARVLDQKETLLNLTERRVDKKIGELKKMRSEIRKVLGEAEATHKTQVASMVKIYQTMKPKDAARIFETMETRALVQVIARMKEAKAAPILAAMNAMKAKEITRLMMTKKELPKAP